MSSQQYTNRELEELRAWVKNARQLPKKEQTKSLIAILAQVTVKIEEIAGQLAGTLSEADDATRISTCADCGVPRQHVFPDSQCPKTHTIHSWKDSAQISPRSFVRIHDGRGRRRPCLWCLPAGSPGAVLGHRAQGRPPRATHLGLLEGVGVTTGCEWHMRAWVKYGFRRKLPAPKTRR